MSRNNRLTRQETRRLEDWLVRLGQRHIEDNKLGYEQLLALAARALGMTVTKANIRMALSTMDMKAFATTTPAGGLKPWQQRISRYEARLEMLHKAVGEEFPTDSEVDEYITRKNTPTLKLAQPLNR